MGLMNTIHKINTWIIMTTDPPSPGEHVNSGDDQSPSVHVIVVSSAVGPKFSKHVYRRTEPS